MNISRHTHIHESRIETSFEKERLAGVGSRMDIENEGVDIIKAHDICRYN